MKILSCERYRDGGTRQYKTDLEIYYFVLVPLHKDNTNLVVSNKSGNFPKNFDGESVKPPIVEIRQLIRALRDFEEDHSIIELLCERYSLKLGSLDGAKLKDCPFCGESPIWINNYHPSFDVMPGIRCINCDFVISEDRVDKTIGVWNNRRN